eukprot:c25661_g1_i1 orf=536-2569(+)
MCSLEDRCMAQSVVQTNRRSRRGGGTLLPPLFTSPMALVKALIFLALETVNCEKPKVCQRRNARIIVRRVKLLSMLFEEVRDMEILLPPSAVHCFEKLYVTIRDVKLLIDDCRESSSMWLLMEHESFSKQFHEYTQDIATALDGLPLELIEVSDEVREQVQLVREQVRKAKLHIDPGEEYLRQGVFSVMREFARKATPDSSKLKQIFQSLHINDSNDCHRELCLLEEEMQNSDKVSRISSLMSFIRYCKCVLYGVTEMEEMDRTPGGDPVSPGDYEENDRQIPDEFKCPISLDLMRDPVIVATGQTYDRASITRWIEDGQSTCPKSGLKLIHTGLIPNYALRSLISQWCQQHNIPFERKEKSNRSSVVDSMASTRAALEATKMTAAFLVEKLKTDSPEVRRQVAYELRLLAKCGMDNRVCIGEAGAIPYLVPLLLSDDPKTQENGVTALLNLSIYEGNKVLIMESGALESIVRVLISGSGTEARENAAATLFSLSSINEYKDVIGSQPGAILGLVQLLHHGSPRGKRDAAVALFHLCVHHANRARVAKAGAVPVLVDLLSSHPSSLADDALAVLAVLAGSAEGLVAISHSTVIPTLVNILRIGSPKSKENSVVVLLALCRYGGDQVIDSVLGIPSALLSLHALLSIGTPRAKRKATSLLRILQRKWDSVQHASHNAD